MAPCPVLRCCDRTQVPRDAVPLPLGRYLSNAHNRSPKSRCGTKDAGMSFGLTARPAKPQPTIGKNTTSITSHRPAASPSAVRMSRRGKYRTKIRSEEHTSELQSLMRISYAVFCLKKKNNTETNKTQ